MTHNDPMYPLGFIKRVLVEELGSMLPNDKNGYPYELFILIAIGVEFLGACEDDYGWHKEQKGLNRKRFLAGMNLFPNQYHKHSKFLYKKLRCGMAHTFAPASGLGIGENKHKTGNLIGKVYKQETIELQLNIQSFYLDFKSACEKVIAKIENQQYKKGNKIYNPFLWVPAS